MTEAPQQEMPVARPWQASVQAQLVRVQGVDMIEEVDYAQGSFTRRVRVVGGLFLSPIVLLDARARTELLGELEAELEAAPPGSDTSGLRVFIELLQLSLEHEPSGRFASARLGSVEPEGEVLYGHLVLGVDVVGTVRDAASAIDYEQHVIPLFPGPYQALSPADLSSLADAIEAAGPQDPGWERIGADARRAANATGTPGSARSCREWSATLERPPGGSSRIHVRGTCQYPTTGYSAELRPAEPQGFVPQTLELELVVHVPTGIEAQHVTDVAVDYEADAPIEYMQVHVRPDGPVLTVQGVG